MSLEDLFKHVNHAVNTTESVVIDEGTFRRLSGMQDVKWNRQNVNTVAEWISRRQGCYASAEIIVNAETMEVVRIYLLCAKSENAFYRAVSDLRRDVEAELHGTIADRVENRYVH